MRNCVDHPASAHSIKSTWNLCSTPIWNIVRSLVSNFGKKCLLRCARLNNLWSTAGLHNSESSKGQIDQQKLAVGRKSLFRRSVEEILKGQVIIRSRPFATFSATEFSRAARKDLAGRMLCRPGLQVYSGSQRFFNSIWDKTLLICANKFNLAPQQLLYYLYRTWTKVLNLITMAMVRKAAEVRVVLMFLPKEFQSIRNSCKQF